eukprot:m.18427 g.18427  ORF g.18427 m.18427 type:complete len:268 (+) comp27656_c0_seq1:216-1019(+)
MGQCESVAVVRTKRRRFPSLQAACVLHLVVYPGFFLFSEQSNLSGVRLNGVARSMTASALSDVLRRNLAFLQSELNPSLYIDSLFASYVLCEEEQEELVDLKNKRRQQASRFIAIMMKKSEDKIRKFLNILGEEKDKQPHIYEKLNPPPQKTTSQNKRPKKSADSSSKRQKMSIIDVNSEATDDHLEIVANLARDKWQCLGRYLKCSGAELEEFREKQRTLKHRLFDILEDWHRRQGDQATVKILLDACERAGCGGQIKKEFDKLLS